jgi:hypothetical protein
MNKITNSHAIGTLLALAIAGFGSANAQGACAMMADIKLTVQKYHLDLNDRQPICVTVPGEFTIKIHNPLGSGVTVGSGDVVAEAKPGTSITIDGDNASPINKLKIQVDGTADPDDEFEFWIRVEGVGELDPTVRVVDNQFFNALKSEALYDLLDTLNLTLEQAQELRPPEQMK